MLRNSLGTVSDDKADHYYAAGSHFGGLRLCTVKQMFTFSPSMMRSAIGRKLNC